MPGPAENPVARTTATTSKSMEPENELRPCHHQLEVHAQEGTPEVRLQQKQIHTVRDLGGLRQYRKGRHGSHSRQGVENETGRSAADPATASISSHFFNSLRHSNTWFVLPLKVNVPAPTSIFTGLLMVRVEAHVPPATPLKSIFPPADRRLEMVDAMATHGSVTDGEIVCTPLTCVAVIP